MVRSAVGGFSRCFRLDKIHACGFGYFGSPYVVWGCCGVCGYCCCLLSNELAPNAGGKAPPSKSPRSAALRTPGANHLVRQESVDPGPDVSALTRKVRRRRSPPRSAPRLAPPVTAPAPNNAPRAAGFAMAARPRRRSAIGKFLHHLIARTSEVGKVTAATDVIQFAFRLHLLA